MSKITFSQAMQGYLLAIGARHLSEHTVKDYVNTFNKFTAFMGDNVPIEDISHKEIEAFFTAQTTVSNKTLLNYHTGLSSLWTWAMREHLVHHHVVHNVTPPKPEEREIVPFTLIEVRAMLAVVGRDEKGDVLQKRMRNSADRNRALLLLLLDTGMRASELCSLRVDRVEEKKDINRIRKSVEKWRQGGYVAITKTTSKLIENSMMNV